MRITRTPVARDGPYHPTTQELFSDAGGSVQPFSRCTPDRTCTKRKHVPATNTEGNLMKRSIAGRAFRALQPRQPERSARERFFGRKAALIAIGAVLGSMLLPTSPASAADRPQLEIVNRLSGLRADVINASPSAYQGVFLWPDNTSASQEFNLLDSGNGYFRIQARHSGQCLMLDWRGSAYSNGTAIIQYPACAAGYAPAEWYTRSLSGQRCSNGVCRTGSDHMLLVNRRTGRCLDAGNAAGGQPPARAILQQWDCITHTGAWNLGNQSWDIGAPGFKRTD